MFEDPGFEIKCKQCGAVMSIEDGKLYWAEDPRGKLAVEIFYNVLNGITISCSCCVERGFEELNSISIQ